jgi:hypothetical protein
MRSFIGNATLCVVSSLALISLQGCAADSGAQPPTGPNGTAGTGAGSAGAGSGSAGTSGAAGGAGATTTAGDGGTSGAAGAAGAGGTAGDAGTTGAAGNVGGAGAGGAGHDGGAGAMGGAGNDGGAAATDGPPVSAELDAACTLMTATFMNQMPASGGGAVFNMQVPDPQALMKQIAKQDCLVLYDDVATVKKISAITLVIESPGSGVAATGGGRTGFSAAYIAGIKGNILYELEGVISHEFTHIYQNNKGPGWMIEGMADFVRYRAGYFKLTNRRKGGNYDDAYQTTGFFLSWVDDQYPNFGRKLNQAMKTGADISTFMTLTGKSVTDLWAEYQAAI